MNLTDQYQQIINNTYKQYHEQLEPKLKTKKGKAYSMITLSFLTMAFFGMFALWPTIKIIARLQREIVDNRQIDQKLSKKIASLALAQANYELIRGALPQLNKALPQTPELGQLLTTIESVAKTEDATISALAVQSVILSTQSGVLGATSDEPTSIDFTFTLDGTYDQLSRFLKALVSSPRLIRVDTITIKPSSDKTASITLSINSTSKGFYYPQLKHDTVNQKGASD